MGNKSCKCEKPQINTQTNTQPNTQSNTQPNTQSNTEKPKFSSWEEEILYHHNKIREENGLTPLVWDSSLQTKAQDWVKFLVEKDQNGMCTKDGRNRHPGEGTRATPEEKETYLPKNWGQNIFQSNGAKITPEGKPVPYDPSTPIGSVNAWYKECKDYTNKMDKQGVPVGWYNSEKPIGHFTQLMWKDARKLGCASFPCYSDNFILKNEKIKTKGSVYVCNYDKGNVAGQFKEQVKWPVNKC